MRLLVTGAGTVGTAVARAAAAEGLPTLLVDVREVSGPFPTARCDVTDTAALLGVFRDWRPDAVVHTAGVIGRRVSTAPTLAVGVNVTGAVSVLDCARRCAVGRAVLTSSLSVYDWSERGVAGAADAVAEERAGRPRTLYGASKLAAETVARSLAEAGGPTVTALRLAGVYGAGGGVAGAVLSTTLHGVVRRLLAGEHVTLPPVLGCVEYLAAADAARAVLLALRAPHGADAPWRALNVGAGRVHTGAELAAALREVVPGAEVTAGPPAAAVPPLDLTAAREVLGYEPSVGLAEGLAELVAAVTEAEPREVA